MKNSPCINTILDNREYLYFSGTSYYCLHKNKEMINAAAEGIEKHGLGSAVSRTTYGNTTLLIELEKRIARFFGSEDAVFIPSGYLSSLAALKSLNEINEYKYIYLDEKSHYSVKDGAKVTGVEIIEFKHLDKNDLRLKIKESNSHGKSIIVSDGVFPLFGTIAPLAEYAKIAEENNFDIWIDDSHGAGVLGNNRRGIKEYFNLENKDYIYCGATLSKAFGSYGGIIYGHRVFIEKVKSGTVASGSNTMPNSVMASAIKGLDLLEQNPQWTENLFKNTSYLKTKLKSIGVKVVSNEFPIAAWTSENEEELIRIHQYLLSKNIAIQHLKYSGCDKSALRIVVFSTHTKEQIDTLVEEISNALKATNQNQG